MTAELTEKEQAKLNEGRMLRAESDMILPLLATKQATVLGKIVSDFRNGHHDKLLGHAAELSTIYEMKTEIGRKIREAEALEKRVYEGGR